MFGRMSRTLWGPVRAFVTAKSSAMNACPRGVVAACALRGGMLQSKATNARKLTEWRVNDNSSVKPFTGSCTWNKRGMHADAEGVWSGWNSDTGEGPRHIKAIDILRMKEQARIGEQSGSWLSCSPDDTVYMAVHRMASARVGALLVMTSPAEVDKFHEDEEVSKLKTAKAGDLVGIMTERDYLSKVVVAGRTSSTTKVHEIMTAKSNLLVLSPCDDVEYAMGLMTENNIRHLPVVHSHHLLGVLSIRDVVRFITNLTSHTDFKE